MDFIHFLVGIFHFFLTYVCTGSKYKTENSTGKNTTNPMIVITNQKKMGYHTQELNQRYFKISYHSKSSSNIFNLYRLLQYTHSKQ